MENEQLLWLPQDSIFCETRTGTEQFKIAIIGPSGGGKSNLAATAPRKPIWFWDYDNRLASVAGKPGVYGKTYLDTTTPNKSTAWANSEEDMQMFEYQKLKGNPIPGTMVYDSITYMSDRAMRKVLAENPDNGKITKKISANGRDYLSPNGWPAYNQEMIFITNFIARGVELGCDVIAIFHERDEEAADSTPELKKFTGKISVHPPRMEYLLPLFDEKWRVQPNYDGSRYEVVTRPNSEFIGKTCLKIDSMELANITDMVEKHKQNLEKEKGK